MFADEEALALKPRLGLGAQRRAESRSRRWRASARPPDFRHAVPHDVPWNPSRPWLSRHGRVTVSHRAHVRRRRARARDRRAHGPREPSVEPSPDREW